MSASSHTILQVSCDPDRLAAFYPLLQSGVVVRCRVGCTLGDLLDRQWGISPEYVARRVTTVFLNSRAIDNVTTAMVTAGATIALSGAMPGLVGATMRRGGYYAAMRGAMTHQEPAGEIIPELATVRVKLFNLLLGELGPGFLQRGIQLSGQELLAFFRGVEKEFWNCCRSVMRDGSEIDPVVLLSEQTDLARFETIRLTVVSRDNV